MSAQFYEHKRAKSVTSIGTGNMGSALARALIGSGYRVTVWNQRDPSARNLESLEQAGASVAHSIDQAVSASDVIVVCVLDYTATKDLICKDDIAKQLEGKTLIQFSTGSPKEARSLGSWAAEKGIEYLDGVLTDVTDAVGTREFTHFHAGSQGAFERCESILLSIGGNPVFVGESPGQAATLESGFVSVASAAWIGFIHGAAMCESEGIPLDTYLSLVTGALASPIGGMMESYTGNIQRRNYDVVSSPLTAYLSALEHNVEACEDNGLDSRLPETLLAYVKEAEAVGFADSELASIFEVMSKKIRPCK